MTSIRGFLRALPSRASKLRALLAQPQYRRALRFRVAASVEHERTPLRGEYGTIVDIGANRGQFALVAAQRFPSAALICIEPQPEPRATLERVLARHPRLRVVSAAVAASAGTSVLHVTQADDSSSLLPVTDLQVDMFPGTHVVDRVPIVTERLDAIVRPEDLEGSVLLKIDVQGTELHVLEGASDLLASVDTILVECSFVELYAGQALADEVISLLHGQDFRLAEVVAPTLDRNGRVLQADIVFERSPS